MAQFLAPQHVRKKRPNEGPAISLGIIKEAMTLTWERLVLAVSREQRAELAAELPVAIAASVNMDTFHCPSHRSSQGLPVAATGSGTSGLKQTGKSSSVGRRSATAPSSEVRSLMALLLRPSAKGLRDKGG